MSELSRLYQQALEAHRLDPCEETETELNKAYAALEVAWLERQMNA